MDDTKEILENEEIEEVQAEVEGFDNDSNESEAIEYASYGGTLLKGGLIGAGAVLGGAAIKKWVWPKVKKGIGSLKAKRKAKKALAAEAKESETTENSEAVSKN